MRARGRASVLLGRHALTVGVVVLRVGRWRGGVVLGHLPYLWGEAAPAAEARSGVVGEVLEEEGRAIGVGASRTEEPSHVLAHY